jgi:hypothetical protein
MSLKHVDLESALRRLADRRIEEAMREGKFDNLAGAGKPLDLEPMPADENARMTWWMLRILKGADFTPDEVRLRRQIESLKGELAAATTDRRVVVLVNTINGLVHQLNTLGTNAIHIAVSPVSLEAERERLRERLGQKEEQARPARDVVTRRCGNHQCGNGNPSAARFCRRCGKVLARHRS